MHEFAKFIQTQLDQRGWKQADLVRESGLSRQHLSKLLNDRRDHLGQMPDDATIGRLATGFGITRDTVRAAAARALVGFVDDGSDLTLNLSTVSTDSLLTEVRRRIDANAHLQAPSEQGTPREAHPNEKTPGRGNVRDLNRRKQGRGPDADEVPEAARTTRGKTRGQVEFEDHAAAGEQSQDEQGGDNA